MVQYMKFHDHGETGLAAAISQWFCSEAGLGLSADYFATGGEVLQKLDHPAIPTIYDSGIVNGEMVASMAERPLAAGRNAESA